MCDPVSIGIAGLVVSGAGAASSYVQGKKAAKSAKSAQAEAKESSEKALAEQQKENNRKNAKAPNVAAILQSNRQATANQTLLSGPGGVQGSQLQLGQNTLLGN